jgi:tRNA(Ile)-lysidine synthase
MQLEGSNEALHLNQEEFNILMRSASVGNATNIAVAVSGGGDSMALTLLLKKWCDENNVSLTALTINHGLRDTSGQEAEQVGKWIADRDIEHHILHWEGDKPKSNIQDEARSARYRILGNWCVKNKVNDLVVAHHLDDQAETFLIRLFRGSGIDGLSAMDVSSSLPLNAGTQVSVHRPLLTVPKKRLIAFLEKKGHTWIEDPSNYQDRYTRIKVRNLLSDTEIEGLNADRMAATADRMRRVKSLLDELTDSAESKYVTFDKLCFATLNQSFADELHEEIALRLLSRCLKKVSGEYYAPRINKLENLLENLKSDDFTGQTLHGTLLFKNSNGQINICREDRKISVSINITNQKQYLWDRRFLINSGHFQGKIVRLTTDQYSNIETAIPEFKDVFKTYCKTAEIRDRILPTLPCIITKRNEVVLWDQLLSILKRNDLDGFSADFKE